MTLRVTRPHLCLALVCALAIATCLASVVTPAFVAHTSGPAHVAVTVDRPLATAAAATSQQLRALVALVALPLAPSAGVPGSAPLAVLVALTAALIGSFAIPLRI